MKQSTFDVAEHSLYGEKSMNKPIIGVIPLVDEQRESFWMLPGYMNGIMEAGGLPIILPLTDDIVQIRQIATLCNAFLLTGGHDVSPSLYGEDALPECETCNPERDAMERFLLNEAIQRDMPVFGICRGIQLINVVLGGTLYQDLPTQYPSPIEHHMTAPYNRAVHKVSVIQDTPLYSILKTPEIGVNSYHHQAIKDLSPRLKPMAVADDGLIEGVYMPDKRFICAVQWHPEFSYQVDTNSKILFKAFVFEAMNAHG